MEIFELNMIEFRIDCLEALLLRPKIYEYSRIQVFSIPDLIKFIIFEFVDKYFHFIKITFLLGKLYLKIKTQDHWIQYRTIKDPDSIEKRIKRSYRAKS